MNPNKTPIANAVEKATAVDAQAQSERQMRHDAAMTQIATNAAMNELEEQRNAAHRRCAQLAADVAQLRAILEGHQKAAAAQQQAIDGLAQTNSQLNSQVSELQGRVTSLGGILPGVTNLSGVVASPE